MNMRNSKTTPVKPLSRRDFLKGAVTLGALSALGTTPLLTSLSWAKEGGSSKKVLSGCHWGVFSATVENSQIISIEPWEKDPWPSEQLAGILDLLDSPSRIKYPMVRRAWLEQGPGTDVNGRGTGDFVRVSWDEALDLVAEELIRVRENYGPTAVVTGTRGWKTTGLLHNCTAQLQRLLKINGGFSDWAHRNSFGAAMQVMPYITGSNEVNEQSTSWHTVEENTELVVFWGCDLLKCADVDNNAVCGHISKNGIAMLKDKQIPSINIDPQDTMTARYLESEWLAIRPQTDVALMLGIAHTLYIEGLYDKSFLEKYTVGFDRFLPYLLGESDGQPKSAAWAAKVSEIPEKTIKRLAQQFSENRTMFIVGYSIQRQHHGEQDYWMLVALASMLGQIGLPGGGYVMSYHHKCGGEPTHNSPIFQGISNSLGPEGDILPKPEIITIESSGFNDMILSPGKKIDFDGSHLVYPEVVKMGYFAGGNIFTKQPNFNETLRAWSKLETCVVHDNQWTSMARYADIVLPATTFFEHNDIATIGTFGRSHIMPLPKIVDPQFESRDDYEIFADIAERLGYREVFTEGRTEMDWIRSIYDRGKLQAQGKRIQMPDFDEFWEKNEPFAFELTDEGRYFVKHARFRNDPLMNPLGTESGKIEIFSRQIEKYQYDDCPPHPTWLEPVELLGTSVRHPLHVTSAHPPYRLHSQLCGSPTLREKYTINGREPCWMNPKDAERRGLKDGDLIRVFNDRGQLLAGLKITERMRPGVIRIDEGGWYDPYNPREEKTLDIYGNVNVLTSGITTSKLAQSNCAHTCLAEVEKYEGVEIPAVKVFDNP